MTETVRRETTVPRYWLLLLLGAFLMLTIPACWLPELQSEEARLVLVAQELLSPAGEYFRLHLEGWPVLMPPLAPWLLAGLGSVLPLHEATVRLLGILSLLALAGLCIWFVAPRYGRPAAAAAGAACISSFGALTGATFGGAEMLFALWLNAGWLSWYILGKERHRWLAAWFVAHLFLCLAMLTGGAKAVFYFYLPLLWLRRPLRIWGRLGHADHWLSVLLVSGLVLLYVLLAPDLLWQIDEYLEGFEAQPPSIGYLNHLVQYPVRVVLGVGTWVFLLWPAFCVAYRPLERAPVLTQYLRTIFYAHFIAFWLLPEGRPGNLLPTVGPLAILLGANYDILVRRHAGRLLAWAKTICWLALLLVPAGLFGAMVSLLYPGKFPLEMKILLPSAALLAIAVVIAVVILQARRPEPVWLLVLVATVALHLAGASAIYHVYRYGWHSEKRRCARVLAAELPERIPVYEMIGANQSFPGLSYYLGRPVQRIEGVDRIAPGKPHEVYLLSQDRVPVDKWRDWSAVSEPVEYEGVRLRLWKGTARRPS